MASPQSPTSRIEISMSSQVDIRDHLSGSQEVERSWESRVTPQRLMRSIEISTASRATIKDQNPLIHYLSLPFLRTGHPNINLQLSAAIIKREGEVRSRRHCLVMHEYQWDVYEISKHYQTPESLLHHLSYTFLLSCSPDTTLQHSTPQTYHSSS